MMPSFLVQFVSLFALALWVGGGAAISFLVAPVVFELAGSRRLAGEIVGQVLRRFDIYALIAGPIACAAALVEMAGTPGPGPARTLGLKLALVAAMLGLALYSRFALSPEIRRVRAELGGEIDAVPREDPRRLAFGRLHGFSVLCLIGEIVLGAFAIGLAVMSMSAPRS
jgi:putative copper export protein